MRFLFEYPYEFLTYYLTLLLRFGHASKLLIVSLCRIHPYKIEFKVSPFSEYFFHLISFVLPHKAVVYEYTGKLFSDSLG